MRSTALNRTQRLPTDLSDLRELRFRRSERLLILVTLPFAALSIVAFLRFCEPRLHRAEQPTSLRRHLGLTYRTVLRRGRLLPIVTLAAFASLLLSVVVEFGPLWPVGARRPTSRLVTVIDRPAG